MTPSPKSPYNRRPRQRLVRLLEMPMVVLSLVWLILLMIELVWGSNSLLRTMSAAIWIIFVADFILELMAAPSQRTFWKSHWLIAVSMAVPALRIFRFARALRIVRASSGLRVVTVVASINRTMGALGKVLSRSGVGYVITLTCVMALLGAAGIYAFEHDPADPTRLNDFGAALWWTVMLFTTIGSDYWPHTPEGRVLCVVLSLYACGVFGYLTAVLATFFIGHDTRRDDHTERLEALTRELKAMREELRELKKR